MTEYYSKSCRRNSDGNFLYEVKGANNDNFNKQITGTYVPKELILDEMKVINDQKYDVCRP